MWHKLSRFFLLPLYAAFIFLSPNVFALSLSDLSNQDASAGLKAALEKGSSAAVTKLGVENGFLYNEKVKIKLPEKFDRARELLRMTGQSKKFDELKFSTLYKLFSRSSFFDRILRPAVCFLRQK